LSASIRQDSRRFTWIFLRAIKDLISSDVFPIDSPSSQMHRISPTAARLSDQSHFGSLWVDGEKTSLSD
jgi:hypothetical protein